MKEDGREGEDGRDWDVGTVKVGREGFGGGEEEADILVVMLVGLEMSACLVGLGW